MPERLEGYNVGEGLSQMDMIIPLYKTKQIYYNKNQKRC